MMLSIPLIALLALGAPAPEATAVAPFLGDEVAAVIHIDLTRLDVETFLRSVVGDLADEADVSQATKTGNAWVDALRKAGAKDLFVLLDPTDFPGLPVVVVPLSDGVDGRAVGKVLADGVPRGPGRWPASETIRGALVAGTPDAVARIREDKVEANARPDLATALAAGGDATIRVAIVPSTVQRRAIEESLPNLPPELGGGPISTLTHGLRWVSLVIAFEPKPALRIIVQAKDADTAQSLRKLAQDGFKLLGQQVATNPSLADVAKMLGQLTPETQGDRILLDADLQKTAELVAVPIRKARAAAYRSQCVNNLKQIGLAMHNYLSAHNTFPPAYNTSKDGKPLLSWRVLILPYIEQESLYKQFKLDEPWDSPHNKALISRMPPQYACPTGSRKIASEGKTTYLTPRGKATIFPGVKAVNLQEITDGTSNTILVVDANDDSAVIWTKPDDWELSAPLSVKSLFGHHAEGTNFGFADGSVRFIKDTIATKVFEMLLTRNGGEVIGSDDF